MSDVWMVDEYEDLSLQLAVHPAYAGCLTCVRYNAFASGYFNGELSEDNKYRIFCNLGDGGMTDVRIHCVGWGG